MVVALGPGKFYGSSLPRPRFYTDMKFNDQRVDPPVPVTDPLMSWAEEAHWSMGGLSFKRHRLQGRIEGSIKKLQAEREKFSKIPRSRSPKGAAPARSGSGKNGEKSPRSPSPPPAPMAMKRKRRVLGLIDEDENESDRDTEDEREPKRSTARKLGDDFERVARENGMKGSVKDGMGTLTRSKRAEMEKKKVVEIVNKEKKNVKKATSDKKSGSDRSPAANGPRTSPRLAKLRSS